VFADSSRNDLLALATDAARAAGAAILAYYREPGVEVDWKADGSPVTEADREAHRLILHELRISTIPVVSEEGVELHLGARACWLVDPLDGTRDFIARTDDFTVNIALVVDGRPVLGVVFAPARDRLFGGQAEGGAWCIAGGDKRTLGPEPRSPRGRLAASRFHDGPDVAAFASANGLTERREVGSALKYGALAAGEVDVFPRLVGSSEWDTAAGQAVLEAAGGQVLCWRDGAPLTYGKPRRRNPRLLALRSPYTFDEFTRQHFDKELA
jgi:3'(2'), 5'-bisphosphate nucleotidase